MFDLDKYLHDLVLNCRSAFKERLLYIGLQGSYLRGEAHENSDIDVMVILDRFSVQDMAAYRGILKKTGFYEKSCGFICGKEEMKCWNPLEVCQLRHTTKDLFGVLSDYLPPATREDEVNYVKLSLGNLYHELCHRYIHSDRDKNVARFRGTCKSLFYLIQNLHFLESGCFILSKKALKEAVAKEDRLILELADLPDDFDFDQAFSSLFNWCQRVFVRIGYQIIILNGPSSSGKSTLARILQNLILKKRGELYEIVSIDDFLKMSAHVTIYEDDVFEISPALLETASRAVRAGGGVIIDHVITSKRIFDQLTDTFNGCNTELIRVTCPREVLQAREAMRGNRCPGSAEASDAHLFPKDGYDLTVDTHAMSAAECAEQIFKSIFHEGSDGSTKTVNKKSYRIIRLLGKGKGGYSYLAESDGQPVVIKQIHHEPCDYYSFGNKIEAELRDYVRLQEAGIRIPGMQTVDKDAERIVKDYIEGPTVMELVQAGVSVEPYLPQVRDMAAKAMAAGLNIDYYPTNFILKDGLLWYVDYECNDYSEQWDFEHWGIQYWLPKVSFRSYRNEDYEAVCGFLIELNQKDRTHINWNWARFEWMMEHREFDKSASSSIGLWWSEGKVVGAAIYDMYFGEAFCASLPKYEALYPEILDYAYRELKDDSGLGIAVNNRNKAEVEAAKAAGFVREEQQETVMCLDLNNLISYGLPEGFSLSELDPAQEAYDFQWLLWQGFDHGEDREEFERKDPVIPQNRRHLNKCLSLTASAQNGSKAAYCCVWFCPDTDYAYVEPVCTVPSCRGRGIAAALLSEALNRAKALGARESYVISDLPFYEKLGFEKAQHYSFYRKV